MSQASYSYSTEAEALEAIARLGGDELMRCTDTVRASRAVCFAAVRSSVDALLWASPENKEDKEIVMEAVRAHGRALRYTKSLRGDKDCCLAAVRNTGFALQFCSAEMRGDEAVVLAALENTPSALQYASKEICAKPRIVMVAAKQDRQVLACAPEAVRREVLSSLEASESRFQTTYSRNF